MKAKNPYNTNLASEFHVMSMLHRKGFEPYLSLGNKKKVDIIITDKSNQFITIDVKGVIGSYDWTLGSKSPLVSKYHYIILVRYNKIEGFDQLPEFYIIPSIDIGKLGKQYSNRYNVSNTKKNRGKLLKYQNWGILTPK